MSLTSSDWSNSSQGLPRAWAHVHPVKRLSPESWLGNAGVEASRARFRMTLNWGLSLEWPVGTYALR